jgi:hypothetical protein
MVNPRLPSHGIRVNVSDHVARYYARACGKGIARSCRGMSLSVVHESESSDVPARARTARFGSFGEEQQQAAARGWCFQAAQSARGAALAEGAFVPAPIVRAVSCYETRRAGERVRESKERKSKRRRRKERKGLGRERRKERDGKQRLSS